MEDYQIIKPSPLLQPYVKHYWFLSIDGYTEDAQRVTPIGSIELIFHRGNRMFSITENQNQPSSFICGQSYEFTDIRQTGNVDMVVITFKPQGARLFFNIPMNEFYGQKVSVDLLGDKELIELQKKLENTFDKLLCISCIEAFLLKRLNKINEYNYKRISNIIHHINKGETNIKTLSDMSFLSYKQFQRVFADNIGSNPKDFLRVVRFQRALYYLQHNPDMNLAQLAVDCDFYDQSHLIKEFKIFSGYTPKEYIAECLPFSDYFNIV